MSSIGAIDEPTLKAREREFISELEIFRNETDAAAQFMYAYLAVHAVAAEHAPVLRWINTTPTFWRTALGALQTAGFIALGRIFDQESQHNVDVVLQMAQENIEVFSKVALETRKRGSEPEPPSWLSAYMEDVYVPNAQDFRMLRKRVNAYRKVYDARYRDLRNMHFAHRDVAEPVAVAALFARTNVDELLEMVTFLRALHLALLELFINGNKPEILPGRHLISEIRASRRELGSGNPLHEHITHETEAMLLAAAGLGSNAVNAA